MALFGVSESTVKEMIQLEHEQSLIRHAACMRALADMNTNLRYLKSKVDSLVLQIKRNAQAPQLTNKSLSDFFSSTAAVRKLRKLLGLSDYDHNSR